MKTPEHQRCSMPVSLWPEADRIAWTEATRPSDIFDVDARAAADWSPARRKMAEMSYGYWLAWLRDRGRLDPARAPGDRVTVSLVSAFVDDLRRQVAPYSVVLFVGGLKRMLEMIGELDVTVPPEFISEVIPIKYAREWRRSGRTVTLSMKSGLLV